MKEFHEPVLYLDLQKFPGGVAMWPGFASVFSTRCEGASQEPTRGIHVHARKRDGKAKAIDYTFDRVFVKVPDYYQDLPLVDDGFFEVDVRSARAYWASSAFGVPLKYLACPHCGHVHLDENELAVKPHRKHLCLNCKQHFYDEAPSVGNPLALLKEMFHDCDVQAEPNVVQRSITVSTQDYPGGIEMWGTAPGILWTFKSQQEAGIHLHCYGERGIRRILDETYGTIWVDGCKIDHLMIRYLQAQLSLKSLKGKLTTVHCPECNEFLFDTDHQAHQPHRNFTCSHGHSFEIEQAVVSNPAIEILNRLQGAYMLKAS